MTSARAALVKWEGGTLEQNIKATATDLTEAGVWSSNGDATSLDGSLYIEELILVIFFSEILYFGKFDFFFFFLYSYLPGIVLLTTWNSMERGWVGSEGREGGHFSPTVSSSPLAGLLHLLLSCRNSASVLQPSSPHPPSCAGGALTLPSGTVHISLAFMAGRVKCNVITWELKPVVIFWKCPPPWCLSSVYWSLIIYLYL